LFELLLIRGFGLLLLFENVDLAHAIACLSD
jgi:hypothetical protein